MLHDQTFLLRAIADFATTASQVTEPTRLYQQIADSACRLLQLDTALLLLDGQDGFRLGAVAGTPVVALDVASAWATDTLTSGALGCTTDFSEPPQLPTAAALVAAGIHAAIGVPLTGVRTAAVLLGFSQAPRPFSALEQAGWQALAAQAELALTTLGRLQALADDQADWHELLDANPDCLVLKDGRGQWLAANVTVLRLLDLQQVDYRGKTDAELALLTPYRDVLLHCQANDERAWQPQGHQYEQVVRISDTDERVFTVQQIPLFAAEGSRRRLVVLGREITEHKRIEETLRLSAEVFANSPEAIFITDTSECIISVNRAFTDITGYLPEDMLGQPLDRLLNSDAATLAQLRTTLQHGQGWRGEIWSRRKSGEIYPQWLTAYPLSDEQGTATHYLGMFSDITERKLEQSRVQHLANHDALTNLPNRLLLRDRIDQALAQASRRQYCLAVLFVDLDRFKVINDTLGHDIGDLLLKAVAARMTKCVRVEDTVARQGGDEFVILLPNLRQSQDAALVAQKLIKTLSANPFNLCNHELHITPSVGISVYPQDGRVTQDLLKNADTAMYHAKERGRNTYQFYSPEMNASAFERLSLENSLRRAIERGEFFLNYQPQQEMASGRLLGMEALIRWKHPEKGLISPAKFIPIAEEIGLIDPIGEWVLRAACREHRRWLEAGYQDLRVAVNLSARQFREYNLLELVTRVLAETHMPPHSLELELTEGMLMQHTDTTVQTLKALSDLGVQLAIDDFGIGYSNLSYLRRFTIHKLKIDQSFVRDLQVDVDAAAIVSAIVAMAHSLKLSVIAEGVETAEQLAFLRERQCDAVQGYALSRPLSVEAFSGFLRSHYRDNRSSLNPSACT